jgi:transposase
LDAQWDRRPARTLDARSDDPLLLRHGYEEAAWDQKIETFLALHENAFRDLGGVPRVLRHDNLKSAVVRACLYDPDSNQIYTAFAQHWGFTPLPTRPRNPRENGKQERSGGYVKDNALKGRRFDSLESSMPTSSTGIAPSLAYSGWRRVTEPHPGVENTGGLVQ